MKVRVSHLARIRGRAPAGYVDSLLAAGSVEGEWLVIHSPTLRAITEAHRPRRAEPGLLPIRGLGDVVHVVAVLTGLDRVNRFVRAAYRMPPCKCAARRAAWNRRWPIPRVLAALIRAVWKP
jgi:hypothetical protein